MPNETAGLAAAWMNEWMFSQSRCLDESLHCKVQCGIAFSRSTGAGHTLTMRLFTGRRLYAYRLILRCKSTFSPVYIPRAWELSDRQRSLNRNWREKYYKTEMASVGNGNAIVKVRKWSFWKKLFSPTMCCVRCSLILRMLSLALTRRVVTDWYIDWLIDFVCCCCALAFVCFLCWLPIGEIKLIRKSVTQKASVAIRRVAARPEIF